MKTSKCLRSVGSRNKIARHWQLIFEGIRCNESSSLQIFLFNLNALVTCRQDKHHFDTRNLNN